MPPEIQLERQKPLERVRLETETITGQQYQSQPIQESTQRLAKWAHVLAQVMKTSARHKQEDQAPERAESLAPENLPSL